MTATSVMGRQTPARFYRLWPHLLTFAAGIYLLQTFHFGPIWGMRAFVGVTVVWWSVVLLIDRHLRRDLGRLAPRARDGHIIAGAGLLLTGGLIAGLTGAVAWSQIEVATGGAILGWLLRRPFFNPAAHAAILPGQIERWALLLLAGVFLISPYATRQLVGSGDAEHYARQLADFLTQTRQGEFPVFVGQSRFAFGGDVHPLRTAPYFQYVGGLLDLLTGRSLHAYALQNLLIVLSFLAALFVSYAALRSIAGRGRDWACGWLALLFATSPGVLALLYGGDLIASWMTLPWLPLLFYGWSRAWRDQNDGRGLIIQAVALALLWLAHAPIALWASILTLASELTRSIVQPGMGSGLIRKIGAGALCLLLCQYVFVAVITLQVPDNPYLAYAMQHGLVMEVLREGWTGLLRTVSGNSDHLLQDLHLSPGLWLAVLIGGIGLGRPSVRWLALVMLLAVAVCTVLLMPLTGLTDRFWNHLPAFILTITEKWPMQRFYPVMSALAVAVAALGLTHPWFNRRQLYQAVTLLLAVSMLWSGWEARKFLHRGRQVTHSADQTQRYHLPENNRLSQYSYEMWGRLPRYFSSGHMAAAMQNRLLDDSAQLTLESNLLSLLDRAPSPPAPPAYRYVPDAEGGHFNPPLTIPAGHSILLRFTFWESEPRGTLLVSGRRIYRTYELPSSGEAGAFGSKPGQDQTIAVTNFSPEPEAVKVRFVQAIRTGAQGRFADLNVIPYEPDTLPVRLNRLIPYELQVNFDRAGWLETPKLLIPGYQATIDEAPVDPSRSPDGLLMLPLTPGAHRISISYVGPALLRWSFWLNFATLAGGLGWITFLQTRRYRRRYGGDPLRSDRGLAYLGRGTLLAAPLLLAGYAGQQWITRPDSSPGQPARISLNVQLPVGRHEVYEPLLAMADGAGNTNTIVAFYQSDRYARIGIRKNGVLKLLSGPLRTSYFLPQQVDILFGPLLRDTDRDQFPGLSDEAWSTLRHQAIVTFNQLPVWTIDVVHQSATDFRYAIGEDPFDPEHAAEKFRGTINRITGLPRLPAAATNGR